MYLNNIILLFVIAFGVVVVAVIGYGEHLDRVLVNKLINERDERRRYDASRLPNNTNPYRVQLTQLDNEPEIYYDNELVIIDETENPDYSIVDNPGGGDCGYYAILQAMYNVDRDNITEKGMKSFRREIVKRFRRRDCVIDMSLDGTLYSDSTTDEQQAGLAGIAFGKTQLTQPIVVGISRCFELNIVVFSSHNNAPFSIAVELIDNKNEKVIILISKTRGNHGHWQTLAINGSPAGWTVDLYMKYKNDILQYLQANV